MAQQEKNIANGKDQKILQHDIEEIDKKVEEVQQIELANKDQIVASRTWGRYHRTSCVFDFSTHSRHRQPNNIHGKRPFCSIGSE